MKQRLLLILFFIFGFGIGTISTGCESKEMKKEHINAAGHPDEQKDSTRLDPKPIFDPYGTDSDTATENSDSMNSEF